VALTKGEVLELVEEFNQDLDYQLGRVAEAEQAYQGASICDEKHLKEAAGEIRKLEAQLNDKNFDIMGYKERIRVLEEANEMLRTNRERANSEIVRLTRDAAMSSQAICSLRAQLAKVNEKAEYLQKCGERNPALQSMYDICQKQLQHLAKEKADLLVEVDRWKRDRDVWKTLHDQNLEMAQTFDRAKLRLRLDPQ
jgi:chromosome segregation ATPase